jgi:hypothetical protein
MILGFFFFFSVVCATICAPLYYLMPIIIFNYFSSPTLKFMELFFPVNVFLLGIDLFQNYINTGKLSLVLNFFRLPYIWLVVFVIIINILQKMLIVLFLIDIFLSRIQKKETPSCIFNSCGCIHTAYSRNTLKHGL